MVSIDFTLLIYFFENIQPEDPLYLQVSKQNSCGAHSAHLLELATVKVLNTEVSKALDIGEIIFGQ